ncbi:MAG: extracellular solute-binding protein [Gammaproteobacteria bacterium]|nr:extracellular solute-binding protein [Gammaproteobacteria bacterium]
MKATTIAIWTLLITVLISPLVQSAESLVIYSGRSDKFVKPVIRAFTEKTGIEVILHSAKSTALLNKLQLEGKRTEADLFLSNDAGSLQRGSDLKLFKRLSKSLVSPVKKNLRASDNSWVGLSARARVLVVNNNAKGLDFVDSVFDLADPRLKGRLAITSSANGSFIAGTTVYMLEAGNKKTRVWLQGMKDNSEGRVFDKHSKVVKAVASGRKDIGLVNHYYIYRHLAKEPSAPIRILLPDQGKGDMGVAWNVAGIAISKYSKKKKAAEKLVAFLLSKQGQKMFAEVNQEYPARSDVAAAAEVPAQNSYKVADVPMAALGSKRNATLDLIESVGMP